MGFTLDPIETQPVHTMSKAAHLSTQEIAKLITEHMRERGDLDHRGDLRLNGGNLYLTHIQAEGDIIKFLLYSNDNLGTEFYVSIERCYTPSNGFKKMPNGPQSEFTGVSIDIGSPDWSIDTAVNEGETYMQQLSIAMQAQKSISLALRNIEGWGN